MINYDYEYRVSTKIKKIIEINQPIFISEKDSRVKVYLFKKDSL
jgi:hypothetical protein